MPQTSNFRQQNFPENFAKRNGATEHMVLETASDFRTLANSAPVVIFVTDIQGRCSYISGFWRQMTGRDPLKDLGYRWVNALHPEDRSRAIKDVLEAARTHGTCEKEYRLRLAGEHCGWTIYHSLPHFRSNGSRDYIGHIGTFADITTRKSDEVERLRIQGSLLLGQEAERKRIGRELHDAIGQKLALLAVKLTEIDHIAKSGELRKRMNEIRECVDSLASETHLISHNLHPPLLTHLGLIPALRRLCKDFSGSDMLEVTFDGRNTSKETVSPGIAISLFRIVQECLANVAKHSEARRAHVLVWRNPRGLHLIVADWGRGFDANRAFASRGLGLLSIRERARMMGGEIDIESAPSLGTRIHVCVPINGEVRQAVAV
jgi:PAS domain S-box-containing protein